MFGLGFSELLLIMVVVLIVFGPEKLPEIARNLGRATGQFRRTMDEFKHEINIASFDQLDPPQANRPIIASAEQLPPPAERLGCEGSAQAQTPPGGESDLPGQSVSGQVEVPVAEISPPDADKQKDSGGSN